MRGTINRVVLALCAGRPAVAVVARLQLAFVLLTLLYASACVFLAMEPVA